MRCSLMAVVLVAAVAGCSGDEPPREAAIAKITPPTSGVLRLAGSGALTPLARALGAAYGEHGDKVVIEDSVGTGGGIRATVDGVVDVGLVSRELSEAEQKLGLVVTRVASDAVVIAAHPDVPVDELGAAELVALYAGSERRFSDGSRAVVLLRDRGESANGALDAAVPGMAAAREVSYGRGFRVLYHDDAMAAALTSTSGAIGVYSLALLKASRAPLKVIALDGVAPSQETLADGRWKMRRPISFVVRGDRIERVKGFLDFAGSDAGRALTRGAGYLPEPTR